MDLDVLAINFNNIRSNVAISGRREKRESAENKETNLETNRNR